MGKLLLGAAAVVASLSLTAGVAAAQTGSVDTSGPSAHVKVDSHNKNRVEVKNKNDVKLKNNVNQKASSGDAKVKHNTTGGDASTGDASNASALSATVGIDNSGSVGDMSCGCGDEGSLDVDTSGPGAKVKVDSHNSNKVEVKNTNNVKLENSVSQKAYTGDASVTGNTTGGDASTGDASNSSSVSFSLEITN